MTAAAVLPPESALKREFHFVPADHQAIARLVYDELGILLPEGKAQLVYGRVAPRVRACGLDSVGAYVRLIEQDEDERLRMFDAITTNHTAFFRESHHFDDFVERMWPRLSQRLQSGGRVRLWSAACSSGEEPYSWLMAALGPDRTAAQRLLRADLKLLATDVSPSVLATARAGIYPAATLRTVPPALRNAWLSGPSERQTVDPLLRDAIAFRPLNLLGAWPMRGRFDAICCRNVMIYFDEPTKARLQSRLADHLETGGMLYIGHSERLADDVAHRFESVGRTAYLKVAA
ncbi:CheR family methyltransferase [Sphingomonas sp. BK235]|jgi:chemotaxis protein methyltransferase CheR|uniref:CheR family methyltransferase n=1 Tax=Sphingomonas sp. BK235 TaxID=2512131 RepID=UPI0010452ECC|nr:CheR family methyltransferase [Sphingomonas sp. BK235]TCP37009.1 chemotaxis protein methyltransferase CheR [Sphingomonas sp. BK235]